MTTLVWEGAKGGARLGAGLCTGTGPGALACAAIGGALGAGVVWLGGKTVAAIIGADEAAEQDLAGAHVDVCSTCPPPPQCGPLNDKIRETRDELEQRYREMKVDKEDLYNLAFEENNPLYRNGGRIGSWEGHLRQFRQKQINLRTNLERARRLGCPIRTPDADRWSSVQPPDRPDRLYHGR